MTKNYYQIFWYQNPFLDQHQGFQASEQASSPPKKTILSQQEHLRFFSFFLGPL
jgi:hypothetical protein